MAQTDLGRVTPLWKGAYSAAAAYERNDVVLYDGSVYWHVGGAVTTGTPPEDSAVWALMVDGSAIPSLVQAARTAGSEAAAARDQAAVSAAAARADREAAQAAGAAAAEAAAKAVLPEALLEAALVCKAAAGDPAVFSDGAGGIPVKSLQAALDPVQTGAGDAAASNERPFVPLGTVQVLRTGKNLFDAASAVFADGYINNTGGVTASGPYVHCSTYLPVEPGGEYCFSGRIVDPDSVTAINTVVFYDVNRTFLSRFVPPARVPARFTAPAGCRYIRFNATKGYCDPATIQLERGAAATGYVPYAGAAVSAELPAAAQSVWGGVWDVLAGTVTPTWRRTVEDGTGDVADGGVQPGGYCVAFTDVADADPGRLSAALCDRRTWADASPATLPADRFTWRTNAAGAPELLVVIPDAATFDDACCALVERPLTFVYPLASPQASLSVAPASLTTLRGENRLRGDTGAVSVTYRSDATLAAGEEAAP